MTVDIKGTQIRLSFSFVFVLTLMLLFCRQDVVLMCLWASLLHELGHIIFMLIFHERILSVDFGAFGLRIEKADNGRVSYKKECIIALGGIIINFTLAFLSIMYYYFSSKLILLNFSVINIMIALFNCVPIEALDMGRALYCLFMLRLEPTRAQRALNIISLCFVNFLALLCIIYTGFFCVNISLIAVTVYLYIITLFKKRS